MSKERRFELVVESGICTVKRLKYPRFIAQVKNGIGEYGFIANGKEFNLVLIENIDSYENIDKRLMNCVYFVKKQFEYRKIKNVVD